MGYDLKAFIGWHEDLQKVESKLINARIILLTDQIAFLPMTEELYNEMNKYRTSNDIEEFMFLTTDVESEILKIVGDRMIAYVEIEYFGGGGGQSGVIWKDGNRTFSKGSEQNVVNEILRQFGIARSKSKDEFETVGLRRHRSTEDWIDDEF